MVVCGNLTGNNMTTFIEDSSEDLSFHNSLITRSAESRAQWGMVKYRDAKHKPYGEQKKIFEHLRSKN